MSGRRKMSVLLVTVAVLALLAASCGRAPAVETALPPETPAAPPSELTTIPMTLYESTEHGFSVEYPEEWTVATRGAGMYFSSEFKDPEEHLTLEISLQYGAEDIVLTDLVSETKAYMEAMPESELTSEGDVTIGNAIPGYEIAGKGDLGTGKVERFRYVILVREKQGLWVGVRGEPAAFAQQEELIDTIAGSFELLPTYTYVVPTPSTEPGTYTSTEYGGFSIGCPAGWAESPPTGRPGEIVTLTAMEGTPGVGISIQPVGEGTDLAEFGLQLSQDLGQHWGDYELVSEGEITLDDGTPAYEIVFSGTMEGYTLKGKYVVVIRGTEAFFIMGYSTPAVFERDEATIDEVIRSFHLE